MAFGLPSLRAARPEERPNILFIMSDDHAVRALSCYDGTLNQTPNIDRIASGGVRFNQSFCTNSVCAPSRAVLLTGVYSHINGVIDNRTPFDGTQVTFPKLLQANGYRTALFGKWHLQSDPTGFDHWKILVGQGEYFNPDFIENGAPAHTHGYVTDIITDDCLEWLRGHQTGQPFCVLLHHKAPHRNWMPDEKHASLYQDEVFPPPGTFHDDYASRSDAARLQRMRVADDLRPSVDLKIPPDDTPDDDTPAVQAERRDWERLRGRMDEEQRRAWDEAYMRETEEYRNRPPDEDPPAEWKYNRYIRDYLRCVASIDDNIGRVLDFLEEQGLADNTIVVYTSDQGFYLGEHGWYDKRFMYEESLRMPLLIRFPREIGPAVNDRDMVLNLDFAPTLLDFARVEVPPAMQGISLRGVLTGIAPNVPRESIYYHYYEYPGEHQVRRHYGVRTRTHKLMHFYHDIDAWELYDLRNDPRELKNLYNRPEHALLVKQLKGELDALRRRYRDTDEQRFLPKKPVRVKHLAVGCPVTLHNAPSARYRGGRPNTLTDGLRAPDRPGSSPDYRCWQGFEGVDLVAVIDLGEARKINSITAGFLQQQEAWIFLPSEVTFAVSNDGSTFRTVDSVRNRKPAVAPGVFRETYACSLERENARYIRVDGKNIGVCPVGHPGAGSKAWIFADEIEVR